MSDFALFINQVTFPDFHSENTCICTLPNFLRLFKKSEWARSNFVYVSSFIIFLQYDRTEWELHPPEAIAIIISKGLAGCCSCQGMFWSDGALRAPL